MTINSRTGGTLPALSEFDESTLRQWCLGLNLPAYRAAQIWHALHKRAVQSFDEITVLPKELRMRLESSHRVRTLVPRLHLKSARDGAEKLLFELHDGTTIETVLIRGRNAQGTPRQTVCVSSQVGCPAACTFCATGLAGFTRNLRAAEIADQVAYFAASLRPEGLQVNNVVYMGMGEPLLNAAAVRDSIGMLTNPEGPGIGDRHITVSTVGIVPQIYKFAEWAGQVNLAVSLHAPNDELRSTLVPYNQRFPISELIEAVRSYFDATHRRVSFEYVLLRGVNDDLSLARQLADLLRPLGGGAHVNIIPWNPFREGKFIRSEGPDALAFGRALQERGIQATIRYSKGLDISAACGQLRELAREAAVS